MPDLPRNAFSTVSDSAAFAGAPHTDEAEFSQAWASTTYSVINDADGWTFLAGTQYASNGQGQGALLRNENGPSTSPEALITLSGLAVGQTYNVAFTSLG